MSTYAHPELLAESEWLATHLNDPNVSIVDCRYYFDGRDAGAIYRSGHLPNAIHLDWSRDLADPTATPPNMLPRPEQIKATMERLGIGDETLVVGYDDEGGHYASRLWFALTYYGHDNVKILNGGIQKWTAEGRTLTDQIPSPSPSRFTPRDPNEAMRIRCDQLQSELDTPHLTLLDVRRYTEYEGTELRAARGGRIPGAIHLFWQENLTPNGTFKSSDEIRRRHEAVGGASDRRIVTYCQGGVRAAHAAFSLRLAGYDDVRIYDGSWAEWGNREDLPIER